MESEGAMSHQGTDDSAEPLSLLGLKGQKEELELLETSKICHVGEKPPC
jgi:hypothetical protein